LPAAVSGEVPGGIGFATRAGIKPGLATGPLVGVGATTGGRIAYTGICSNGTSVSSVVSRTNPGAPAPDA
jgi:hypothetical protein